MSPAEVERRRSLVPKITYPAELPVSQRRDDIAAAIRDHQVVIVAGETGSGKTTQLPKICLELGRGINGMIGHTQPRRIAARSVGERIAEELHTTLGEVVGYQVRFTDRSSKDTLVKLMTDGILLAELQHDRMLSAYDTLIIDEAHERSLNIDFIIGYLRQLLPRRPDLKVVITSATIDPQRFSKHFGDAPIVEVSGRTYPVEVRYRPLVEETYDDDEGEPVVRDQTEAIVEAAQELIAEGPGDILVFLPGEQEIRDTADVLSKLRPKRAVDEFDVVPLYARLSSAEQHKVFERHTKRRVVLSTNVAETSLTVPGIRYVVDAGFARISRYSFRTKVQRLPIEPISQASANQRKGRCGRVEAGVCIRLYSEEDFESRPEFTDPEILRTNLASVILQMTALGLGDVARFPFVDPPDQRNVKAGVQLLEELGAIDPREQDPRRRLTKLGRQLVVLPIDPRLARMIVEADRLGCLREVLVVAAALSIQDPRERPADHRPHADQMHARFRDEASDFMTLMNLWRYVRTQQKELSSSAFRRMCKAEFLNYLRIREWQELESQLRQVAKQLKLNVGPPADGPDEDAIHQALLSGLLSHIGLRDPDRRDYLGARNARFSVFPGSGLFKKQPQFLMSAELVETSKLWGRVNAAIKPEWAETLGAHLVKRTYSEPHWSKKRAAVMAYERVTLYGVPLVVDRLVSYAKIDPAVARELFIRHALVYGEWSTHQKFFAENRALLDEVEELEHRARRHDILVDEHTLFDFYDGRVGEEAVSGAHFDAWWKRARRERPDLLTFDPAMLVNATAADIDQHDYPDEWHEGDLVLPLSYQFEPGAAADGLTIDLAVATLNRVEADSFSWQVPGLRKDLVVALIRSLPKQLRVNFVPAPNFARDFLAAASPGEEPLLDALERYLRATTGVVVPRDAWDWSKVPDHLRPTFRVLDDKAERGRRGQGPRGAEGAVAAAVPAGDGAGGAGQRDHVDRADDVDVRPDRADVHPVPGRARRAWLPGARRRVAHHSEPADRRGAGVRLRGGAGGGAPARPAPAADARDPVAGEGDHGRARQHREAHPGRLTVRLDPGPARGLRCRGRRRARLPERGTGLGQARIRRAHREGRCRASRGHPGGDARRHPGPHRLAADRPGTERFGRAAHASRTRGHEGAGGKAGPSRVHLLGRGDPAAGGPALPRGRRGAAGQAAVGGGPRPVADGPGRERAGGLPEPGVGASPGAATERAARQGALDARGVPGQPVGTAPRHGVPGLGHPDPEGPRRDLTDLSGCRAALPGEGLTTQRV